MYLSHSKGSREPAPLRSLTRAITDPWQNIWFHMSHFMKKPTKWHMCPAKTQISPVWSESLPSAWRKLWSLATHWAHCKDWSDWVDAQANLSLRWAPMPLCWFCNEVAHISVFIKRLLLLKNPMSTTLKILLTWVISGGCGWDTAGVVDLLQQHRETERNQCPQET